MSEERKKILLHTDVGSDVDDALSLLAMLNHPQIDLRGIYTVNGDVDSRSRIAKHMVNLSGKNIPVLKGEGNPISAPVKPYNNYVGNYVDESFEDKEAMEIDGNRDVIYKSLYETGIKEHGLEELSRQLYHDKYTIFSIGPLTNLARLVEEYPESAKNIERIYAMASRFPEGMMEHNVRYDTGAAEIILSSDLPLTIIPSDVCSRYKMPIDGRNINFESGVGKYVAKMLKGFVGVKLTEDFGRKVVGSYSFDSFLEQEVKPNFRNREVGLKEYESERRFRNFVLNNMDGEAASLEADEFLYNYFKLVDRFKDPRYGYRLGAIAAKEMEDLVLKEIPVHDVYVPYVFLNPDKVKTEKMTLGNDNEGRTLILPGRKHDVVKDLDYGDFKKFVREYVN